MTEDERNDLLVEIKTQMKTVCARMSGVEEELKKRQCLLHTNQIDALQQVVNPAMCNVNTEKIKTLEKLTWAAVIAAIGLIAKSFWSAIST